MIAAALNPLDNWGIDSTTIFIFKFILYTHKSFLSICFGFTWPPLINSLLTNRLILITSSIAY